MTERLEDLVHLTDPEFYMGYSFELYGRIRHEAPLYWSERDNCWLVTKYEDVRQMSRTPSVFANRYGTVASIATLGREGGSVGTDSLDGCPVPHAAMARHASGAQSVGEHINTADPPRHAFIRKIAQHAFTPRAVALLEEEIEILVKELVDRIEPGVEVDFVETVAAPVPMTVIARMLGVPTERLGDFQRWSDAFIESTDADADPQAATERMQALGEFRDYFTEQIQDRVSNPRDDLLTKVVEARENGQPLSFREQLAMCYVLLIAGNETTRSLIANGVLALHRHPDQRKRIVDDPSLLPNAIEELLRYQAPVSHMCRTAMADTELRGHQVKRGDYLVMLYTAANHDEELWERPDELDITRNPYPNLAFGFAEHFCLGANLARREAKLLLGELLRRYPNYEVLDENPPRTRAHMTPGIKHMPVIFRP
jgi:cytochrome P450